MKGILFFKNQNQKAVCLSLLFIFFQACDLSQINTNLPIPVDAGKENPPDLGSTPDDGDQNTTGDDPPAEPDTDLADCERAPNGSPFVERYRGLPSRYGYRRVQIAPGQKKTFCFNIQDDRPRLGIALIDRTSVSQCFSHRAIFYPPAGSGLETAQSGNGTITNGWYSSPLEGWDNQSAIMWWARNWKAPKGIYKVTLELNPDFSYDCGVFELTTD